MADKTIDRWTKEGKAFMKALKELDKKEVRVGYLDGLSPAYPDSGKSTAEVAAYNEFGTSTIPPRPFMRRTVDNNESKFLAMAQLSANGLLNGSTAEHALNELGAFGVELLQSEIKNGDFEPNAQSTVAKKGSNQPLVDTGHLRQSAHYRVHKKGE